MASSAKVLQILNGICLLGIAGYLITKTPWTASTSFTDANSGIIKPEFSPRKTNFESVKEAAISEIYANVKTEDYPSADYAGREREVVDLPLLHKWSVKFPQCEEPFYRLAFVKTHKCASDTISAHLMRLAEENSLEVPLPTGQWNLNWPYPPGNFYHSRKKNKKFDMQILHMMYAPETWDKFMEPDYKLISVVRQPFHHFKSFFNYFAIAKKMNAEWNIPINETFRRYLENPEDFFRKLKRPFYKNTMTFDFGFQNDIDEPHDFVKKLADKLSLVMVSDYFDESMIVLRHQFCLNMRDILIKIKNVSRKYVFGPKESQNLQEEERLENQYMKYAPADYLLFDTFNRTLWKKIAAIPNFYEELEVFRNLSSKMDEHCVARRLGTVTEDLVIPAGKYNELMIITAPFCTRAQMSVLGYISRLKSQRYDSKSPYYPRIYV